MENKENNFLEREIDILVANVDVALSAIYADPSEAMARIIRLLEMLPSWNDAIAFMESRPTILGKYLGTPTGVERQEAFRALRLLLSVREELNPSSAIP